MGARQNPGSTSSPPLTAPDSMLRPCDNFSMQPAEVCSDTFSKSVLFIFRFVGAAYVTGASDCWEAAYRFADDTIEISDGPLVVTRVAALVRLFRANCARDFAYMPTCCSRLSKDEIRLMRILETARGGASSELMIALSGFVHVGQEAATLEAINALVALSPERDRRQATPIGSNAPAEHFGRLQPESSWMRA
jgi:hypothetical protein